uniref:Uncharacterized protein n=1 Tax=Photinus pyralis TaxID=7054 RepID=A0A1Y1KKX0_PHOPY
MNGKLMYAFRGWIAFVAFVDLGTAIRSYIEKRSFLNNVTPDMEYDDGNADLIHASVGIGNFTEKYTVSRVVGIYSVLKALALIHCTLFIHYKPIVSMGICSIILTIVLYITETLYFRSATLNFLVIFPCVLNSKYFTSHITGHFVIRIKLKLHTFRYYTNWLNLLAETFKIMGSAT